MLTRKEIFHRAKDKLNNRRLDALSTADIHKEKIYAMDQRFEQIDMELAEIGANAGKAVLKGSDAVSELQKMRDKSRELQNEYDSLLEKLGFDRSYLEPKYTCQKCKDTGYVEIGNKTVMCECLSRLLVEETCRDLNRDLPLDKSTFESFTLDYYPDDQSAGSRNPRLRMKKILNYCMDYAEFFSDSSKNILMQGSTGLGKTHLSLSIANVLIRKGFSVIYMTASQIVSKMESQHFSYNYNSEEEFFDSLIRADLLIIDDLGTEFNTQFSASIIYNLFNTRILRNKPVIISTNVTMGELESLYSQRFVSRIIGNCDRLEFLGQDIRALS